VEYKLREDGNQSLKLSWLQASEGMSDSDTRDEGETDSFNLFVQKIVS